VAGHSEGFYDLSYAMQRTQDRGRASEDKTVLNRYEVY
jgi:hypothetical protein